MGCLELATEYYEDIARRESFSFVDPEHRTEPRSHKVQDPGPKASGTILTR